MTTDHRETVAGDAPARVLGTRPVRLEDTAKVTGQALFGADVRLPNMLHGAVLRSPHAHARIISVDTSRALALPGVTAVVTGADLPAPAEGVEATYQRQNILAQGKVLYFGHALAAVAATSLHIAKEALGLIDVAYEALPVVVDVLEAMRPGAPILLEDLCTDEMGREVKGLTNVASHVQYRRGDPERGFREASVIVEREFSTETVHQGYIEPHNATALYDAGGQVTIWCSTQGAFAVRQQVADVLGIAVGNIRVIPLEIGGGFGGKNDIYLEPVAALLSQKSGGRPVKMVMGYDEVLAGSGPTSASVIRVKMGAAADGRITAATAWLAYAAGAFPGAPLWGATSTVFAPYRLDHLQIDGYDVVVNRPKTASYRAPGASNAVFAAETVADELAERLGIDPLEFHRINAVQEGDRRADGPLYPRIGYREVLDAARRHPHLSAPLGGPNRGRGVAVGIWMGGGGQSSASASINADGTVSLVTGSVDLSGTRMTSAMQLAETLGIPVDDVRSATADTASIGYTDGSWGSRTTFSTGRAVHEVGRRLIAQLIERAAELWGIGPDAVAFEDGHFSGGGHRAPFRALAAEASEAGGPIMAGATSDGAGVGPASAAHIVDVEVDPDTGKVQILRYTAIQDVGRAIHPAYLEGQIQGGVAQGIGWALHEGYVYDEAGRLLNTTLLDYRLPTCGDLPAIEPVLLEIGNPGHPFGVRGAGEMPIVPPPAAIANAIYRAAGVRMEVLPMSPGRILEALWVASA